MKEIVLMKAKRQKSQFVLGIPTTPVWLRCKLLWEDEGMECHIQIDEYQDEDIVLNTREGYVL